MSQDWPARVRRLEDEVAGLRRAMRARSLIEQAKGMLAERLGCDPETAFEVLSLQSQQTNTPLTSIAADLVGRAPIAPDEPAGHGGGTAIATPLHLVAPHATPTLQAITGPALAPPVELPRAMARKLQLALAALDAATNLDDLVRALVTVGLKQDKGTAAALFLSEVDGATRLLSCEGWPTQTISAWRRVPPSINTTVATAVRTGLPVIADGAAKHEYMLIGPGTTRAAFPLASGLRVVGALLFAWPDDRELGPPVQRFLALLAAGAGRTASRLWSSIAHDDTTALSVELDWVKSILDGVTGHAHLLSPIRDAAGRVTDFLVEAASRSANEVEPSMVGRRLLDGYPHLAENGVFDAYLEVLANGVTWEANDAEFHRRAAPVGGALLASWEEADQPVGAERLRRLETVGGFGWAEWNLGTGEAAWSSGMFRLFGRSGSRAPLTFEELSQSVEEAHLPRLERFHTEIMAGTDSVVELRLTPSSGSRWLRLYCEAPQPAAPEKKVQLLAQDVSERYAREQRMRSMQSQAATGRLRLASEQELTTRLSHLLYPKSTVQVRAPGVLVTGRHRDSVAGRLLQTDFCDAVELPDGRVLAIIGDMFGAGTLAAAIAVHLIRPVIALGTAGLSLNRILDVMNADLRREEDLSLASLLLTRLDPATGELAWSSAGHMPPILLRGKRPRVLTGAAGPVLGLTAAPGYTTKRLRLLSGDAVVCYTDGIVNQTVPRPLAQLQATVSEAYHSSGAAGVLGCPLPRDTEEACLLIAELNAIPVNIQHIKERESYSHTPRAQGVTAYKLTA